MITNEQTFLLKALSDHLRGNSTEITANIDIEVLKNLAMQQQLEAIMYYQTHNGYFEEAFAASCYRAVERKYLLKRIHSVFLVEGIKYLIFKGPELAKYYPSPELRVMGDLDILVPNEMREKAHNALLATGCKTDTTQHAECEWVYYFNDNEIELHNRLLYTDVKNDKKHTDFTDTVWEKAYLCEENSFRYYLPDEFLFLFTVLHLRKHLLWSGVGLRQFYDLTVMIKNTRMDWDYIGRKLNELDMMDFASVCFSLIERWFDISAPLPHQDLSEEQYEQLSAEILEGGAFGILGIDDDEMYAKWQTLQLHGEKHKRLKQLKKSLAVLFPSYDKMKAKYPQMIDSRLLLPIMWIRRMVEAIFRKRAIAGIDAAAQPISVNLDERERMLRSWGIKI